jgi:predicted DsbA family dithiol-disulfide isomerase
MAHEMAIVSERVTADVVEANEFPELSQRFAVSGVPKIVINDTIELLGSQREPRFLQAVIQGATPPGS